MNTDNFSTHSSIDWQLSIKLANNNKDLAKDLLQMFITDLPKASESIHYAYDQQQHSDLLSEVHRLHGASCYCGVAKLKTILAEMESSLKEKAMNQFNKVFKEFDAEVANILTEYKTTPFI